MKEALELFGNITFKDTVIFLMAIYWLYSMGKRAYLNIINFHKKKTEIEDIMSMVTSNREQVEGLKSMLEDIRATVEENAKRDIEYRKRSLADKLFVCYNSVKQQGYITTRQLENYLENEKLYTEIGGNGIVKEKYHPFIIKAKTEQEWIKEMELKQEGQQ